MNTPNPRLIILAAIVIIGLLVTWALIPKAKLKLTTNVSGIQLDLNSKSYLVQNNQTLTLRAGSYAYVATKDGYAPAKGFVDVKDSAETTLNIELHKQFLIEKEYPEYAEKYPNTTINAEFTPQGDWLVVQLVSQGTPTTKTLIVLNKTNGSWKILTQGQDYVTPVQIADLPQSIQNWLSENNFVSQSNTDTGNDNAGVD